MRLWPLMLLAVVACKSKDAPVICHDCNVVLITVDTLRHDHATPDTMPHAARFFARGSTFVRATSPSPCTLPAVQQLLTGTIDAVDAAPRLAETLASRGYRTAAFVSQHFLRDHRGPRPKFARGYQQFDIQGALELDHHGMTRRRAAEVSDRAIAWLNQLGPKDRFHLWLHYFDPHDPYTPPNVKVEIPEGGVHPGDRRARQCGGSLRRGGCERRGRADGQAIFSADETRELVELYDGEVRYVDQQVGRVLDLLDRQRTVVVLTSDHGERLGEEGRWDHCQTLHGWEIDVPLLFSVPGGLGANLSANVSTLDIVPTLHGLLGLGPVATDGLDLRTLPPNRRVVTVWQDQYLVLGGDWKLFVGAKSTRLVNTSRDAAERRDLSTAEPAVRAEMIREVQDLSYRYRAAQDESQAIVERLRAIGYIQ